MLKSKDANAVVILNRLAEVQVKAGRRRAAEATLKRCLDAAFGKEGEFHEEVEMDATGLLVPLCFVPSVERFLLCCHLEAHIASPGLSTSAAHLWAHSWELFGRTLDFAEKVQCGAASVVVPHSVLTYRCLRRFEEGVAVVNRCNAYLHRVNSELGLPLQLGVNFAICQVRMVISPQPRRD